MRNDAFVPDWQGVHIDRQFEISAFVNLRSAVSCRLALLNENRAELFFRSDVLAIGENYFGDSSNATVLKVDKKSVWKTAAVATSKDRIELVYASNISVSDSDPIKERTRTDRFEDRFVFIFYS